jgi:hypothetical protein
MAMVERRRLDCEHQMCAHREHERCKKNAPGTADTSHHW